MAIIGLFQCDPWCLPTQNWLKNTTNDISLHEFHNVTRHYVKDTDIIPPWQVCNEQIFLFFYFFSFNNRLLQVDVINAHASRECNYSSTWGQYQRTKPHMACLVDPGASFDTPGNPGVASIVEISAFQYLFLIFLYDSATWRIFFIILKLKPDVTFIDLTCIKMTISLLIAQWLGFQSDTSCECCNLNGIRANKSNVWQYSKLSI